jgi:hypothetical protein
MVLQLMACFYAVRVLTLVEELWDWLGIMQQKKLSSEVSQHDST